MKLSNDVEKYEIEVTKMGQNYSLFFTVIIHSHSTYIYLIIYPDIVCLLLCHSIHVRH